MTLPIRHASGSVCVNDIHSGLNPTLIARLYEPATLDDAVAIVRRCRDRGESFAVAGGRHAMGGQQFLSDGVLIDTRKLSRVRRFDEERGLIEVEAGIQWPALFRSYLARDSAARTSWGIRQKQTGADRLTIGGAIAANIHGRCLTAAPFVEDIESLEVVTPRGAVVTCNRVSNPELFRHIVGGYGLFGLVTAATLRLVPRRQVQRRVELLEIGDLMPRLEDCIASGALYGDFQFAIDSGSTRFLRTGILSCYLPTDDRAPIPLRQRRFSNSDWGRLLDLAHRDKARAFDEFTDFYLKSSGQRYWSDTHQLNLYLEGYHAALDARLGSPVHGGEMITELYVPRHRLTDFMDDVRSDMLRHPVDLIYGTIRLIERDDQTALPWARDRYACVIFNLHVDHLDSAVSAARVAFQRLIDHAIAHDGSYYLTYHDYARRDQLLECHPALERWVAFKRRVDPQGTLQSDWYRRLLGTLEGPCA